MATEITTLKIKAERLGTIQTIVQLLTDIENAYNSIYTFDFLVETLYNERERLFRTFDSRDIYSKDFQFDPRLYRLIWDRYQLGGINNTSTLLDLQNRIDFGKVVIPSDKLVLVTINIQSPGFWEILGSFNPLQQIREYLKDRHERQKDRKFRSKQEEELGDLSILEKRNEIMSQRIDMLRKLGYNELEIRQFVSAMVIEPLHKLGLQQDNGQIDGIDE